MAGHLPDCSICPVSVSAVFPPSGLGAQSVHQDRQGRGHLLLLLLPILLVLLLHLLIHLLLLLPGGGHLLLPETDGGGQVQYGPQEVSHGLTGQAEAARTSETGMSGCCDCGRRVADLEI